MAVYAAYRPGTCPDHEMTMFTQLESDSDIARQSCCHMFVAGDSNVYCHEWLGSIRTTAAREAAEDLCFIHNLASMCQSPLEAGTPLT